MNLLFSDRSAGIDLLRCFSVLLVVFSHYGVLGWFPLSGTHGVVIFFMVSGYCMSYSMRNRNGQQFLSGRFWRLVPTLIICATITEMVEFLFSDIRPDRGQSFKQYGANLICLPFGNLLCDVFFDFTKGAPSGYNWVDGAYWSLLVEIRFYILFWVVCYLFKLKVSVLFISSLGLLSLLGFEWDKISKSNDFLMYLPFFAFGMAYREFVRRKILGLLLMGYCILIFACLSFVGVGAISMSLNQNNFLSYVSCFCVFVCCVTFYRTGRNKVISYFGVLSYPLYLIHQDVGLVIIGLIGEGVFESGVFFAFAIVLVVAATVNSFIERYQSIFRKRVADCFRTIYIHLKCRVA